MARVFFALVPPPAVMDLLEDACEGLTGAHWVTEPDFHLTLAFVGEVPPHRIDDLVEIADRVRPASFRVALESVGVFPTRGRPRVLWAGVVKEPRLLALERTLRGELGRGGFPLKQRKFHPHVTLARIEDCPPEEISDWLARHMSLRAGPFGVFEFHLVASQRSAYGSRYRSLERFALRR